MLEKIAPVLHLKCNFFSFEVSKCDKESSFILWFSLENSFCAISNKAISILNRQQLFIFIYSDKKWWTMLTFRVLQLANLAKIRLLLAIWAVWLVLRPYVLSLEQLKGFCWFWDLYFIIFGISYIRIETYVIHIYNIWQNSFE